MAYHPNAGSLPSACVIADDQGNVTGYRKCAMFRPSNGVSEKHLKDWAKYKAVMEEASSRATAIVPNATPIEGAA